MSILIPFVIALVFMTSYRLALAFRGVPLARRDWIVFAWGGSYVIHFYILGCAGRVAVGRRSRD